MKRRYGRFTIANPFIEHDPATARAILGLCIVLRAESLFFANGIEYYAYSELFDEISEGEIVPEYRVEISSSGPLDQITVRFVHPADFAPEHQIAPIPAAKKGDA